MALKDLFRPKWKHSQSYTRLKAIANISDTKILAKMATTDSSKSVRKEAVEKLSDTGILTKIAKNDNSWEVRRAAYLKLGNEQAATAEFLKNSSSTYTQYSECQELLEKFTNEELIADIALHSENPAASEAAAKKLSSQGLIASIAQKSENKNVRAVAVKKLEKTEILEKIVRTDESWLVRKNAHEKLGNTQAALKETAKHETFYATASKALKAITNLDYLQEIAREAIDENIRTDAKHKVEEFKLKNIEKNTDTTELEKIAETSQSWEERYAAYTQLGNTEKAIYENLMNAQPGEAKAKEAVEKISRQDDLVRLVYNAKSTAAQKAAAGKIEAPETLLKIALEHAQREIRLTATRKIENPEVLEKIARTAWCWKVGTKAFALLEAIAPEKIRSDKDFWDNRQQHWIDKENKEIEEEEKRREEERLSDLMDDAYERMANRD